MLSTTFVIRFVFAHFIITSRVLPVPEVNRKRCEIFNRVWNSDRATKFTIAPSCLGHRAMTRWRWRDDSTEQWRCYDGDKSLTRHVNTASHRTIALSTFFNMRCLKKTATELHCSSQMSWFIYPLSNILHVCIKCIVIFIIHFNQSIRSIRF